MKSAVVVGSFAQRGLCSFCLLRCSGPSLHLLLSILGRGRSTAGLLVHCARWRMLTSGRICTHCRSGVSRRWARACVPHLGRFAGAARSRVRSSAAEPEHGGTNENKLMSHFHLPLPWVAPRSHIFAHAAGQQIVGRRLSSAAPAAEQLGMRDLVVTPRIARPITGAGDDAASGFFICSVMRWEDLAPATSNVRTPTFAGRKRGGLPRRSSGFPTCSTVLGNSLSSLALFLFFRVLRVMNRLSWSEDQLARLKSSLIPVRFVANGYCMRSG